MYRAISLLAQHGFIDTIHPPDGYSFSARQLSNLWRYWGQAALRRGVDIELGRPQLGPASATSWRDSD